MKITTQNPFQEAASEWQFYLLPKFRNLPLLALRGNSLNNILLFWASMNIYSFCVLSIFEPLWIGHFYRPRGHSIASTSIQMFIQCSEWCVFPILVFIQKKENTFFFLKVKVVIGNFLKFRFISMCGYVNFLCFSLVKARISVLKYIIQKGLCTCIRKCFLCNRTN